MTKIESLYRINIYDEDEKNFFKSKTTNSDIAKYGFVDSIGRLTRHRVTVRG